jgi:hypothetical protein
VQKVIAKEIGLTPIGASHPRAMSHPIEVSQEFSSKFTSQYGNFQGNEISAQNRNQPTHREGNQGISRYVASGASTMRKDNPCSPGERPKSIFRGETGTATFKRRKEHITLVQIQLDVDGIEE